MKSLIKNLDTTCQDQVDKKFRVGNAFVGAVLEEAGGKNMSQSTRTNQREMILIHSTEHVMS